MACWLPTRKPIRLLLFYWQGAIYGLFWAGFSAFPAASYVLLEDLAHATDSLVLLCEVSRRHFVTLPEAGVSTWGRLPSNDPSAPSPVPRILAVIDEFANLADTLPTKQTAGTVAWHPHDCRRRGSIWRSWSCKPPPIRAWTCASGVPTSFLPRQGRRRQPRHSGYRRCRVVAAAPVHDGDGPALRGAAFAPVMKRFAVSWWPGWLHPTPAPSWLEADVVPATASH